MGDIPALDPSKIDTQAKTPKLEERWIPLWTPKPEAPLRGLIVTSRPLAVLVHWVNPTGLPKDGRTVPHTGPDGCCPICCTFNQIPRWTSYLGVFCERSSRYVLFQVSQNAAQGCPPLQSESTIDLRGRRILLKRTGRSATSPVVAELSDIVVKDECCPPSISIRPALLRLWGLTSSKRWFVNGEYQE
jgi:hypothetical protein